MLGKFFKHKTAIEKADLHKKGICPICSDIVKSLPPIIDGNYDLIKFEQEEEPMFDLCGVEVCEGCFHDILNHMRYKNIDTLMDCDKKQLNKFLNMVAKKFEK